MIVLTAHSLRSIGFGPRAPLRTSVLCLCGLPMIFGFAADGTVASDPTKIVGPNACAKCHKQGARPGRARFISRPCARCPRRKEANSSLATKPASSSDWAQPGGAGAARRDRCCDSFRRLRRPWCCGRCCQMITEGRSPSIDKLLHCHADAAGGEPCWLLMGDRANSELGEVKARLTSIEAGLQRSRLASCG